MRLKNLLVYSQYLVPQHSLSMLMGCLANSQSPWLKNFLIKRFIHRNAVDMKSARIENPDDYASFNDFFIRELKPGIRPIAGENYIASPVDGIITQFGTIHKDQLLQAKDSYFDLITLLGGDQTLAKSYHDGHFIILYLAPHNYHRVHMPLAGQLQKTIYVPGKLFSVNHMTSQLIPNLYSQNERLICNFQTEAGEMAVIMIAAIIVGQIKTAFQDEPLRAKQLNSTSYSPNQVALKKGEEMGYFKMGSTVVLLFQKDSIAFLPTLLPDTTIRLGEALGQIPLK